MMDQHLKSVPVLPLSILAVMLQPFFMLISISICYVLLTDIVFFLPKCPFFNRSSPLSIENKGYHSILRSCFPTDSFQLGFN